MKHKPWPAANAPRIHSIPSSRNPGQFASAAFPPSRPPRCSPRFASPRSETCPPYRYRTLADGRTSPGNPTAAQVLFARSAARSARTTIRGIVDHGDQVHLLAPTFQPIMRTGIPLHQLPKPASPRPPMMHRSTRALLARHSSRRSSISAPSLGWLRSRVASSGIRLPTSARIPGTRPPIRFSLPPAPSFRDPSRERPTAQPMNDRLVSQLFEVFNSASHAAH